MGESLSPSKAPTASWPVDTPDGDAGGIPAAMPEASQRVAGGERSDTTGFAPQGGPHPGRGASASPPNKARARAKNLSRRNLAPAN